MNRDTVRAEDIILAGVYFALLAALGVVLFIAGLLAIACALVLAVYRGAAAVHGRIVAAVNRQIARFKEHLDRLIGGAAVIRTIVCIIQCCDRCQQPLCDWESEHPYHFANAETAAIAAAGSGWFVHGNVVLCSDTVEASNCRAADAAAEHNFIPRTGDEPGCLLCGQARDADPHPHPIPGQIEALSVIELDGLPVGVTVASELPRPAPPRRRVGGARR